MLGQTRVEGKTNEVTRFAPLLDTIELTGVTVTADALHTLAQQANYLHTRRAHFIFTVKANQPKLRKQCKNLPWKDIPILDRTVGKGALRR